MVVNGKGSMRRTRLRDGANDDDDDDDDEDDCNDDENMTKRN